MAEIKKKVKNMFNSQAKCLWVLITDRGKHVFNKFFLKILKKKLLHIDFLILFLHFKRDLELLGMK